MRHGDSCFMPTSEPGVMVPVPVNKAERVPRRPRRQSASDMNDQQCDFMCSVPTRPPTLPPNRPPLLASQSVLFPLCAHLPPCNPSLETCRTHRSSVYPAYPRRRQQFYQCCLAQVSICNASQTVPARRPVHMAKNSTWAVQPAFNLSYKPLFVDALILDIK